jgi:hypothetical protein
MHKRISESFIKEHTCDWLEADLANMEKELPDKKEAVVAGLKTAIGEACRQAQKEQAVGRKGKIACLYLSFLRTNLLENVWEYRLDLYDEDWFSDRNECSSRWQVGFIWDYFQKRYEKVVSASKSGVYTNKIRPNILEEIKLRMAPRYHTAVVVIAAQIIREALQIPEMAELTLMTDFRVLIGEYMDQWVTIYEAEKQSQEQ